MSGFLSFLRSISGVRVPWVAYAWPSSRGTAGGSKVKGTLDRTRLAFFVAGVLGGVPSPFCRLLRRGTDLFVDPAERGLASS